MNEDCMEELINALKAMPKDERDRMALHLLGVLNGMEIADMMHEAKPA